MPAVIPAPDDPANCQILVKVVPGARQDQIVGLLGDRLKIRVAAPPEAGKANAAVCRLLAAALGRRETDLSIIAGHTSPEKTVRVLGRSPAAATAALGLPPSA